MAGEGAWCPVVGEVEVERERERERRRNAMEQNRINTMDGWMDGWVDGVGWSRVYRYEWAALVLKL